MTTRAPQSNYCFTHKLYTLTNTHNCPKRRCMGTGHYLIRFGRGSNDYAAMWGGMRQPVVVELSVLRHRDK